MQMHIDIADVAGSNQIEPNNLTFRLIKFNWEEKCCVHFDER